MNPPSDLLFAKSHEWLRLADGIGTVGISDHAQAELTDVVYVELPTVGKTMAVGEVACVVESVKAASDLYAPVGGVVEAVNEALRTNPSLVNTDPYGEGWIYRVKIGEEGPLGLLSAEEYAKELENRGGHV